MVICTANLTHDWLPWQPSNKTDQMSHAQDDICEECFDVKDSLT